MFFFRTNNGETLELGDCEGNPPVTGRFPDKRTVMRKVFLCYDAIISRAMDNKTHSEAGVYKRIWFGNCSFCGLVTKNNWTVVLISPCHATQKAKPGFGHIFPETPHRIVYSIGFIGYVFIFESFSLPRHCGNCLITIWSIVVWERQKVCKTL